MRDLIPAGVAMEVNKNDSNYEQEAQKAKKTRGVTWVTVLMTVLLYIGLIIGGCYLFMFLITWAIVANM